MPIRPTPLLIAALALSAWLGNAHRTTALPGITACSSSVAASFEFEPADLSFPPLDLDALAIEDEFNDARVMPFRFAVPRVVDITTATHGTWTHDAGGNAHWRLRITCPNATSINLGFSRFHLPSNGSMTIRATNDDIGLRPLTAADNPSHGELWMPVVPANDITIELVVPHTQRVDVQLKLAQVNLGYRGAATLVQERRGDARSGDPQSGLCNVDIACPEALAWAMETASVALYSVNGTNLCTAALINNASGDQTPYLLTAKHCGANTTIDHTIVVYFNYEHSFCRTPGTAENAGAGDGVLTDFALGARVRAAHGSSDFLLMELRVPINPAWNVTFAGWDRTGADPSSSASIHHPQAQEKRIAIDNHAAMTTSWGGVTSPGDGTHVRVVDWDMGTTEAGSNGAPLFNQEHRIVGQLHGGFAACGNDLADWYGGLAHSWVGGASNDTSLAPWLDPLTTGVTMTDTRAHVAIQCLPAPPTLDDTGAPTPYTHAGPLGGPMNSVHPPYQLINATRAAIQYDVEFPPGSVFQIAPGGPSALGALDAQATLSLPISTTSAALALPEGTYEETILIRNLTNDMTFARRHQLIVGRVDLAATDVPLAIPDQSPSGITSEIEVTENICVDDLDVAVVIEHSFIGDLVVTLTGPNGHLVTLHDRTGNQRDNLMHVYDDEGVAPGAQAPHGPGALADFDGQSAQGVWTLRVSDLSAQDIGAIHLFSLRIRPQDAAACQPILPYHMFPLDVDPLGGGWSVEGDWSFGVPAGLNGTPPSAFTGSAILAYAMGALYPPNMPSPETLTTAPLDCTRLCETQVRFRRWLGVEGAPFDHASVEVSTDGLSFTPVWTNGGVVINESSWSQQIIDLSAFADDQPAVWIRWSIGPTDGDVQLHGWNLDDIEVWGVIDCPTDVAPSTAPDAVIDVQDLLMVLTAWGACPAPCPPRCAGDVDGDCEVNVTDLLAVLSGWGPCE